LSTDEDENVVAKNGIFEVGVVLKVCELVAGLRVEVLRVEGLLVVRLLLVVVGLGFVVVDVLGLTVVVLLEVEALMDVLNGTKFVSTSTKPSWFELDIKFGTETYTRRE
jgi:hypothetical protein